MFNLINFCKFFANNKIITTGSRASIGTMKRTADDRLYFSILGQKIELVFADGEWRPAAPDLFAQEQEQAEEQAQEEQEEPTPAPIVVQEEPTPAPIVVQEEPTPAPIVVQEEPTSPIYRYFETREGSSIGVYKTGDDTIIGIADKAGNLWSWRNLGKQGKKRVQYTIFGDEQQLNSKELGSIHGAIIEARNFLQAAKKAKKSAKAEIKAAFLGQEPIKIAEIQLNNAGFYKLTVFTLAGEAIVPKTEPKTEEVPILAIDPVFNEKTEGISDKITKLRELKEQTRLILEQLKAEGLSIEQIKALLGN